MCFVLVRDTKTDSWAREQDPVEGNFRDLVVRPRWDRDPIPQLSSPGQSRIFLTPDRQIVRNLID
jgi:hypothetical protein